MSYTHRTMIVPVAYAPLARALAAAAGPAGSGAGMFETMLSPTAGKPPTHYISAGQIWQQFADVMPTHDSEIWDAKQAALPEEDRAPITERPEDSDGHPDTVVQISIAAKAQAVQKHLIDQWTAAHPGEQPDAQTAQAIAEQATQLAQAAPPVTLAQVQALFAACRVYTCDWQTAVQHLGLHLVKEDMQ